MCRQFESLVLSWVEFVMTEERVMACKSINVWSTMSSAHLLTIGTVTGWFEAHCVELWRLGTSEKTFGWSRDNLHLILRRVWSKKEWWRFQNIRPDEWQLYSNLYHWIWVELTSDLIRGVKYKGGDVSVEKNEKWAIWDSFEKRERSRRGTRRNLGFRVASWFLNAWLIAEGDAWGTSYGGRVCINLRTLWSRFSI